MKKYFLLLLPAIIFLIVTIATLSDYGINEDSTIHFLRGQAYLQILTGGGETYSQPRLRSPILYIPGQRISTYKPNASEEVTAVIRPVSGYQTTIQATFDKYLSEFGRHSFYQHQAWNGAYFKNLEVAGHPPLSDILAAATNRLFYEKLGILGDIEGYHLYAVFSACLLILAVWFFSLKVFGLEVALFSTLFLALYPLFFSESHFNIKDIPETSFFSISLISFYFWLSSRRTSGSILWLLIFNLSTLVAFGTKLNAVFLPVILILWLILTRKNPQRFLYLAFSLLFVTLSFIILWPYLWDSPLPKIMGVLDFYKSIGSSDLTVQIPSPFLLPKIVNLTGLMFILTNTPIIILTFFVFGLWLVLKRRQSADILLLVWLLVPILRVTLPKADVFGSMRQFLEFLPAMAIIAGIGVEYLLRLISSRVGKSNITTIIFITVITVILALPIIRYHPNENIYFNGLVGGPKGALKFGLLDWQASYDNPYRQAVNWLNTHAEEQAKLAFLDGSMEAISPLWLRGDLDFGSYFSGFDGKGEYIISIVYPNPPKVFAYLYPDRFLTPLFEVKSQGVTLARVWKNDQSLLKAGFKKSRPVEYMVSTTGQDQIGKFWQVNFDKPLKVVSLEIKRPEEDCNKKNGLFNLSGFIVPQRIDQSGGTSIFYFPAEETSSIKFYGLTGDSCILNGQIKTVEVLE